MGVTVTVRQLDPEVKAALQVRAAEHGRSMEAEIRAILEAEVRPPRPPEPTNAVSLAEVFAEFRRRTGGVELDLPPRDSARAPVSFE